MPNNFVSALDYGADPTGQTDSSAAIQAAIDAVEATVTGHESGDDIGGGTVLLPGIFLITKPIVISKANVGLEGVGRATFLADFRTYDATGNYNITPPCIQVGSGTNWYASGMTSTTKYNSIKNINFKRRYITTEGGSGNFTGILVSGVRNIHITGVLIERADIGIYFENASEIDCSDVSIIGTNKGIIGDSRYNTSDGQNPLPGSHTANDFSSNRFDMITCYYMQHSGFQIYGGGTTQLTGATFGHNCIFPDASPALPGMPEGNGGIVIASTGQQVRGLLFQDVVFEPNPAQTERCYLVHLIGGSQKAVSVTFDNCISQTYRSFNEDQNTERFNDEDTQATRFFKVSGNSSKFVNVKVNNCGFLLSALGYFFGKLIEEDVPATFILDNLIHPNQLCGSTLKKMPILRGKKVLYNVDQSGWELESGALKGWVPDGTPNYQLNQNGDDNQVTFTDGGNLATTVRYRELTQLDTPYPYFLAEVSSFGDSQHEVTCFVNSASDTNLSDINATNVGRYGNAVVPYKIDANETKYVFVSFVAFAANFGFTTVTWRFGKSSGIGADTFKHIEYGVVGDSNTFYTST